MSGLNGISALADISATDLKLCNKNPAPAARPISAKSCNTLPDKAQIEA